MKALAVAAIALWVAIVCQQALPDRMAILGARPDFILTTAICLGLLIPSPGSVIIGFIAGVGHSATIGANLMQFVLSRMASSYAASRISELEIEIGVILASACVLIGTLGAQTIMMFLAPPRSLGGYIGDTIQSAIYNAVIAAPLYATLGLVLKRDRS